jgi:MFS family permease
LLYTVFALSTLGLLLIPGSTLSGIPVLYSILGCGAYVCARAAGQSAVLLEWFKTEGKARRWAFSLTSAGALLGNLFGWMLSTVLLKKFEI